MSFRVPEQFRLRTAGPYDSSPGEPFGVFRCPSPIGQGRDLRILADDGAETGWEHVSVSVARRAGGEKLPTWREMAHVKALFWEPGDVVVEFHPREEDYVNFAEVLHLWRWKDGEFPTPPPILVGVR
jgi:hypothetical protein